MAGRERHSCSTCRISSALSKRIEPSGKSRRSSKKLEVTSVTEVGARVRVGLASPQPLVAEVTAESVRELGLERGAKACAVWKSTATRIMPR